MMKVKPFSYHIPRRKAHFITRSYSTRSNYSETTNSNISCITCLCSSFSLCAIGTVLILVLLGFIGVAGQGKLSEMEDTPSHLRGRSDSFRSLHYLPHLDALEESEDEDEVLQRRISAMGQFGVKYRNNSFSHNYSTYPAHHHHRSTTTTFHDHNDPEYKLDDVGTIHLSPPLESHMSLHDQRNNRGDNNSGEIDRNTISQQSLRFSLNKRKRRKHKGNKQDVDEDVDDESRRLTGSLPKRNHHVPVIDATATGAARATEGRFLSATRSPIRNSSTRNMEQSEEEESLKDDEDDYSSMLFPFSSSSASSEDEKGNNDDDEYEGHHDILERFIPGNSSHLSGRQRFRQSSQAEVDEGDDDGNDSLTSTRSSRRRPRRSVVHLYDMVVCSTGCNPLIFKGYGCYCGFLGSGHAIDGIDKCCAKHDFCYHHAKCPPLLTYFVPYYWRCDHGRPQCVTDFRGWKGVCGAHLCECDRQFAECLKKFPCPRSRAMCVTSPWSQWHADPRTFPFARRPPRIPMLPYPLGRIFTQ